MAGPSTHFSILHEREQRIMAKPTTPKRNEQQSSFTLPEPISDPRNELFYLLGILRGRESDLAVRIAQLVLELIPPAKEEV